MILQRCSNAMYFSEHEEKLGWSPNNFSHLRHCKMDIGCQYPTCVCVSAFLPTTSDGDFIYHPSAGGADPLFSARVVGINPDFLRAKHPRRDLRRRGQHFRKKQGIWNKCLKKFAKKLIFKTILARFDLVNRSRETQKYVKNRQYFRISLILFKKIVPHARKGNQPLSAGRGFIPDFQIETLFSKNIRDQKFSSAIVNEKNAKKTREYFQNTHVSRKKSATCVSGRRRCFHFQM